MSDVVIEHADELEKLCQKLSTFDSFALDTEFVRERTFFIQLGIVQVAAPGIEAVIDPRALSTLEPLYELLVDESLEKVVHAGEQAAANLHHVHGCSVHVLIIGAGHDDVVSIVTHRRGDGTRAQPESADERQADPPSVISRLSSRQRLELAPELEPVEVSVLLGLDAAEFVREIELRDADSLPQLLRSQ